MINDDISCMTASDSSDDSYYDIMWLFFPAYANEELELIKSSMFNPTISLTRIMKVILTI
jgi:hypothetical protein